MDEIWVWSCCWSEILTRTRRGGTDIAVLSGEALPGVVWETTALHTIWNSSGADKRSGARTTDAASGRGGAIVASWTWRWVRERGTGDDVVFV